MTIPNIQTTTETEIICHKCGVVDRPNVEPGHWGPHRIKSSCRHCGVFLQWLSSRTPAEREAARQQGIDAWRATQPPSEKQLRFLKALGHGGPPANRLEASRVIDALLKKRGVA